MNTMTTTSSNPFTSTLHNVSTRFPKTADGHRVTETAYTVTTEGRICGRILIVDIEGATARMLTVTLRDLEVRFWDGQVDACANPRTGRDIARTEARLATARQVLASAGLRP